MKKIIMFIAVLLISNVASAKNIVSVNGHNITQENLENFVTLLVNQGASDSKELREQIKEELINRQILLQEAEKDGTMNNPIVKTEIQLAKESIIVRSFLTEFLKKNKITDNEIETQYEKLKKDQSSKKEYKVRHILTDNKNDAINLIIKLNADTSKFAEIAKETSKDESSKLNGGLLGWSNTEEYVEEFATAVKNLSPGTISQNPIKTKFGWHIIKLDETRNIEFPELSQVRPQIEEMLKQQVLSNLQKELRSKSIIK
ncbi:peptidyl-prolyl cis-trans isomerase C [Candidatus Kinetoplastibacterium crithidii (ex Angomonas deanei ATCC 30255)]|uniref:peptidylprolyl isomerase n=1 Tax=Candidatus Kinetoplastidibacterium crithidiae TaxID=33056 RepID=UPI0002A117EB|nr:peptidylprolyl isomerase [Candidatus Kinetoplastibacterium crithidii]AFZ82574.1 peptidyl-prolyl cis-trans isomerase C [Candidatus Kinetoplastibacterium crithidii (ex Angomonas deanei ATCC 30255)]